MGLFGSKTKTYWNSTSAILYEEGPKMVKQTAVAAVLQNRNIARDIVDNLANGISFGANRMYNYARLGNLPWGLPDGHINSIPYYVSYNIQLVISKEIGSPVTVDSVTVDRGIVTNAIIYIATYRVLDSTGVPEGDPIEWTYDTSTGIHPILDVPRTDTFDVSPYYPIIPIRQNNVYMAEKGQLNRSAIVNALRFVQLNPDDIHDAIKEAEEPIEDAYVVTALEVTDTSNEGKEYLWNFFRQMHLTSEITKANYDFWAQDPVGTPPINSLEYYDENYKVEIGWLYIEKTIGVGLLSSRYTHEVFVNQELDIPTDDGTTYTEDVLRLRKQISPNNYEEYRVVGLVHSNWAVGKELRTTLFKIKNNPEVAPSFTIPLRRDILNTMATTDRHDLMYKSIRLVLNDKQVRKLKWFETGFFKAIVLIVALVITIVNPPLGIAAFSAAAVGYAIVSVIFMQVIIPVVFKALQDVLGEELTLLLSILVTIYAGGGSISSVLSATTQAIQGITTFQYQKELQALTDELNQINKELDAFQAEEAAIEQNVLLATEAATMSTFSVSMPDNYVRQFKAEVRHDTLLNELTENFVKVNQFTDRPLSQIHLGHTGA